MAKPITYTGRISNKGAQEVKAPITQPSPAGGKVTGGGKGSSGDLRAGGPMRSSGKQ